MPKSIEVQVQEVFAEVTRYPKALLTIDADLEEELGVDSVKRVEIMTVLQQRLDLDPNLQIPPGELRTIASIARAIEGLGGSDPSAPLRPPSLQAPPTPQAPPRAPARPAAPLAPQRPNFAPQRPEAPPEPRARTSWRRIGQGRGTAPSQRPAPRATYQAPEAPRPSSPPSSPTSPYGPRPEGEWSRTPEALRAVERGSPPQPAPEEIAQASRLGGHSGTFVYKPLEGKLAFVTGSGRGIGKVIAEHLASLGAGVLINSFHSKNRGDETTQNLVDRGVEARHLWGSVANPRHLDEMFDQIEQHYGALDFYISNASNGILAPLEMVTSEHWDRAFRTNVVSLQQAAYRAAPLMAKRGGGRIITLSTPGAQRYVDSYGCMGPVKAAVESLTRYLSVELGPYNIQVNCVSSGPVYGELLNRYPKSGEIIAHWESLTYMGELAGEGDVADMIGYLLGPGVHATTTGNVFTINGPGGLRI